MFRVVCLLLLATFALAMPVEESEDKSHYGIDAAISESQNLNLMWAPAPANKDMEMMHAPAEKAGRRELIRGRPGSGRPRPGPGKGGSGGRREPGQRRELRDLVGTDRNSMELNPALAEGRVTNYHPVHHPPVHVASKGRRELRATSTNADDHFQPVVAQDDRKTNFGVAASSKNGRRELFKKKKNKKQAGTNATSGRRKL